MSWKASTWTEQMYMFLLLYLSVFPFGFPFGAEGGVGGCLMRIMGFLIYIKHVNVVAKVGKNLPSLQHMGQGDFF